jgi:hypothetical protein
MLSGSADDTAKIATLGLDILGTKGYSHSASRTTLLSAEHPPAWEQITLQLTSRVKGV